MSVVSGEQIPYTEEVWNVIEAELKTGFKDVYRIEFNYSAEANATVIVVSYHINDAPMVDVITLSGIGASAVVLRLCEKFNVPTHSLNGLEFHLKPDEIPNFTVKQYPYVCEERK